MTFLNHGVPFNFGAIRGTIFGGPFKNYEPHTRRLVGVKMAQEINHPHEISIPTRDYSVPDTQKLVTGMQQSVLALHGGNDIYAGCMGGVGRTGLFMACMIKVQEQYAAQELGASESYDPVEYVRSYYNPHAVETEEQQDFVRSFDTAPVFDYAMGLIRPVERVVEVERILTPWEWAFRFMFPPR